MNRSCPAKFIGYDHDREYAAGEFNYYTWAGAADPEGLAGILFGCPCGCGKLLSVPFRGRSPPENNSWDWDGNKERPTLTPSILNWNVDEKGQKTTEHWHGFLTAGEFKGC